MYAVGTQAAAAQRTGGDGTSCDAMPTPLQRDSEPTPKPELSIKPGVNIILEEDKPHHRIDHQPSQSATTVQHPILNNIPSSTPPQPPQAHSPRLCGRSLQALMTVTVVTVVTTQPVTSTHPFPNQTKPNGLLPDGAVTVTVMVTVIHLALTGLRSGQWCDGVVVISSPPPPAQHMDTCSCIW